MELRAHKRQKKSTDIKNEPKEFIAERRARNAENAAFRVRTNYSKVMKKRTKLMRVGNKILRSAGKDVLDTVFMDVPLGARLRKSIGTLEGLIITKTDMQSVLPQNDSHAESVRTFGSSSLEKEVNVLAAAKMTSFNKRKFEKAKTLSKQATREGKVAEKPKKDTSRAVKRTYKALAAECLVLSAIIKITISEGGFKLFDKLLKDQKVRSDIETLALAPPDMRPKLVGGGKVSRRDYGVSLKKYLGLNKYVVDVKPDGNCFWRVIARCISGDENQWADYKVGILDWIVHNPDYRYVNGQLVKSLHKAGEIGNYRKDGEFADTGLCWAVAEYLNCIVEVYDSNRERVFKYDSRNGKVPFVRFYHRGIHFQAVVNARDDIVRGGGDEVDQEHDNIIDLDPSPVSDDEELKLTAEEAKSIVEASKTTSAPVSWSDLFDGGLIKEAPKAKVPAQAEKKPESTSQPEKKVDPTPAESKDMKTPKKTDKRTEALKAIKALSSGKPLQAPRVQVVYNDKGEEMGECPGCKRPFAKGYTCGSCIQAARTDRLKDSDTKASEIGDPRGLVESKKPKPEPLKVDPTFVDLPVIRDRKSVV